MALSKEENSYDSVAWFMDAKLLFDTAQWAEWFWF